MGLHRGASSGSRPWHLRSWPPTALVPSVLLGFLLGVATEIYRGPAGPATTRDPAAQLHLPAEWVPPPQPAPRLPEENASRRGPLRVAVCVSGHLRRFVMPGLAETWERHLLRRDDEVVTDVWVIAKLGGGRRAPTNMSDPRLQCPMAVVKPWLRHFEVLPEKHNECGAVIASWTKLGFCRRLGCWCCGSRFFLQVAGIHAVIHTARASGIDYDYYLRVRPDTFMTGPVHYHMLNQSKVAFMYRGIGTAHDHFFVVGRGAVDVGFQMLFEKYYPACLAGGPDNQGFPHRNCHNRGCERMRAQMQSFGDNPRKAFSLPDLWRGGALKCALRANITQLKEGEASTEQRCQALKKACGPQK